MIWDPYEDNEGEELPTELAAQFPDYDDWEILVEVSGEPANIEAALVWLIETLDTEPHGDDDMFDYWPSGVRYAMALDAALGGLHAAEITTIARQVITASGFAEELLAKVGLA